MQTGFDRFRGPPRPRIIILAGRTLGFDSTRTICRTPIAKLFIARAMYQTVRCVASSERASKPFVSATPSPLRGSVVCRDPPLRPSGRASDPVPTVSDDSTGTMAGRIVASGARVPSSVSSRCRTRPASVSAGSCPGRFSTVFLVGRNGAELRVRRGSREDAFR